MRLLNKRSPFSKGGLLSKRGPFGLGTGGGSPGSLISRKRIPGMTGSATASNFTGVMVVRAPAAWDQVRLILHVAQTNLPGSAVKMTLAPSAKAGRNPVTAADAAVAFTAVTWGAGATSITVANAANSADGGIVESDYISDLLSVASLDRADTPGLPPLLHVRINASSYVPLFSQPLGAPDAVTEPDYITGTVAGDQTSAVLASNPTNTTFHVPVTIVFYHRGQRVVTIGAAGDSTMQGSSNSAAAIDNTQGRWNGYHRQLKDTLIANGIAASVEQMCLHGDASINFHERARSALTNLDGAGLTHLMFYPLSTNDPVKTTATFNAAKARALALIDLAVSKGVVPILVRNPPGYETQWGIDNGYNAFLDQVVSAGKAIVYDPRPPMGLAASGYPAMPDAGRLHDSGGVIIAGDTHPNNVFHATIAADMFAKRAALKMAN